MSSLVIPSGYVGSIVSGDANQFVFNTVDASGQPTTLTAPSIQARSLFDGSVNSSTGLTLTTDYQTVVGLHHVSIDTTSQVAWPKNTDFAIELSSGSVGATDVKGSVVGSLSVAGKSSGRLYDQAVKVWAGVVTGVDAQESSRIFTGSIVNGSQTIDQYKYQVVSFQPKADGTASANQGIGRSVLKSQGLGSDLVQFTLQDGFQSPINVGDEFKVLPEERELTIYTANITAEWGQADQVPRDQYSVWWSANGSVIQNPDQVIDQMQLQVWRRVSGGPDVEIINENLTPDANSGVYHWDETTNFIAQNDGALMLATALIDNIPISFPRVLYNYV